MSDFSETEKDQIELEVRRILSSEEIQLRKMLTEEAAGYRDFLQRQFKQVTLGITALAAVGAALFVWFFSDSVAKTQSQLEATVDAKILDYRIVESFRERVNEIVEISATSDRTSSIISAEIGSQATGIVTEIAEDAIQRAVAVELSKIEGLDVDALLQRASLPTGALLAFTKASTCPEGWQTYEPATGRFILGAGSLHPLGEQGGAETHTLSLSEMPTHTHPFSGLEFTRGGWGGRATRDFAVGGSEPVSGLPPKGNLAATGGGAAHNNMPPFVALSYCQKL